MALALFDIDGTITHEGSSYGYSMQRAIKQIYDKDVSVNLNDFHGYTDRLVLEAVLRRDSVTYTPKSINKCLDLFGEIFPENPEDITIIGGVLETVPHLSEKHTMGLLTGNVEPMARKKLKKFLLNSKTLNDYFTFGGFGSDQHSQRADLIPLAIKRAYGHGWNGKGNVYLLDDSVLGLQAASQSGVIPIGITTGIYSEEQLRQAKPRFIVRSFRELADLME